MVNFKSSALSDLQSESYGFGGFKIPRLKKPPDCKSGGARYWEKYNPGSSVHLDKYILSKFFLN